MLRVLLRGVLATSFTVALLAVAILLFGREIVAWLTVPSESIWSLDTPSPPDYANPENWSALPGRRDTADATPRGSPARDRQATAQVDCFYVHPTTYFFGGHWNASTNLWLTNFITDGGPVIQQASAFNGTARVFAPRYRQMTLGGYSHDDDNRREALGLAYGDVHRAFRYYLEHHNDGRPFFLASHSQGSHHLLRLLEERIEGTPLADRLIAAYVIGTRMTDARYRRGEAKIPLCESAEDTGCAISWATFAEGGDPHKMGTPAERDEATVCTNPLSWTRGNERIGREHNLGSIPLVGPSGLGKVDPRLVGAQCRDGVLWINVPGAPGYDRALFPGSNYHTYDFNLFYMNIRENARRRAESFLASHASAG